MRRSVCLRLPLFNGESNDQVAPGFDVSGQVPLKKADMYAVQAEEFVTAIRTGDCTAIRSLYSDAAESYKVSQWITAATASARS